MWTLFPKFRCDSHCLTVLGYGFCTLSGPAIAFSIVLEHTMVFTMEKNVARMNCIRERFTWYGTLIAVTCGVYNDVSSRMDFVARPAGFLGTKNILEIQHLQANKVWVLNTPSSWVRYGFGIEPLIAKPGFVLTICRMHSARPRYLGQLPSRKLGRRGNSSLPLFAF